MGAPRAACATPPTYRLEADRPVWTGQPLEAEETNALRELNETQAASVALPGAEPRQAGGEPATSLQSTSLAAGAVSPDNGLSASSPVRTGSGPGRTGQPTQAAEVDVSKEFQETYAASAAIPLVPVVSQSCSDELVDNRGEVS